jgi:hypothetical protein
MSDDIALLNQRPESPVCGAPMVLSHIALEGSGVERRTFECRSCGKAESYLVELDLFRRRPTPTMWRD